MGQRVLVRGYRGAERGRIIPLGADSFESLGSRSTDHSPLYFLYIRLRYKMSPGESEPLSVLIAIVMRVLWGVIEACLPGSWMRCSRSGWPSQLSRVSIQT